MDIVRRYAILEHRWKGIHWDLLVENGQVLRTWAIQEIPTEERDLLALALPDHRLIYLDYEGEISGDRGVVTRWDSGTCEVLEWSHDRVRMRMRGIQVDGLVDLRCLPGETEGRWLFRWGKLS